MARRKDVAVQLYTTDPKTLQESELKRLKEELELDGVVSHDSDWDYDEGTWEAQACDWGRSIDAELRRRWDLGHPEEARARRASAASLAEINSITLKNILADPQELFFTQNPVFDSIRRSFR